MIQGRGAGVLAAVAAGALLLTGTGTTFAGWVDTVPPGESTIVTSGALRTELVQSGVSVRRGGTTLPASEPLLPGDVVEITTSLRLTVHGVAGELTLDAAPAADALTAEDVTLGTPSIAVTGLAPGPVTASSVTWSGRVTEADDGALVTATVKLPLSTDLGATAQGRLVGLTSASDVAQESTLGGWRDRETVPLGSVRTDKVALAVTPTGPGTASVTNTSGAASVTWAPTAVSAAPGARTTAAEAGAVLSGLTIGYGTDCTSTSRWQAEAGSGTRTVTGTPAPLAAGASSGLCASATPTNPTALVRSYGARTAVLAATVTATADVAPSWSATGTAPTAYQVAFPQPTGLTCTSGDVDLFLFETPAELTWSWAGSTNPQPAVALWELRRQRSDGSWQTLNRSVTGSLRVEVSSGDVSSTPGAFKVRAYPFSASGTVDRSVVIESDTVASLRRSGGAAVCDGSPRTNTAPDATPIPGGLS